MLGIVFLLSACNRCRPRCQNGSCVKKSCSCDVWYSGDACDKSVLNVYQGYYVGTVTTDSNQQRVGFNLSVGVEPDVMVADSLQIQLNFTDEARFEVLSQETNFGSRSGEGEMLIDIVSIRLDGVSGLTEDELTIEARKQGT